MSGSIQENISARSLSFRQSEPLFTPEKHLDILFRAREVDLQDLHREEFRLMLKKLTLSLVLILVLAALCPAQDLGEEALYSPDKKGSLGLGFGTPYGGLGINADVYFFDSVALSAGVGSFGYTAGYELGIKYFYGSSQKTWRPQLLLFYGINGIILVDRDPEEDIREAFPGFTIGLGSQFMFGKKRQHGFDIGVLYVLSSGMFKRMDELEQQNYLFEEVNRFKFSLGYRYAFDFKY